MRIERLRFRGEDVAIEPVTLPRGESVALSVS